MSTNATPLGSTSMPSCFKLNLKTPIIYSFYFLFNIIVLTTYKCMPKIYKFKLSSWFMIFIISGVGKWNSLMKVI